MLIGLKIHTDQDGFQAADAPESYNTGDFLADILRGQNHGSSRQNWALKDGPAGKILDPKLSLEENGVRSGQELYLVSTVPVKTHILELEITAPNLETLQCEAPSSMKAGVFLAELVRHFRLPELDDQKRPNRWKLVHGKTGQSLDSELVLADNRVATGDSLSIEATPYRMISLDITSPTGDSWQQEVVEDMPAGELRKSAIAHFALPKTTATGKSIDWSIFRRDDEMRLDSAKSLAENGLESGVQLQIVQVSEPPLALQIRLANGEVVGFEPLADALAGEFLKSVIGSLKFDAFNKRGKPHVWVLVNARTNSRVDLQKSLEDNDIKSGDQLSLVLEITDLRLEVTTPNGAVIPTVEPGDTLASVLLRDLVVNIPLPQTDAAGKTVKWELRRKDTNKRIELEKSLSKNGLGDGVRLLIRQEKLAFDFAAWFKKNSKIALFVLIALLGCLAIAGVVWYFFHIPPPPPPQIEVQVTPKEASPSAGQTQKFTATVKGRDGGKVNWTTQPTQPEGGTITPDGIYTAPASVATEQLVTVIATSVDDGTKSDKAQVTLLPPAITVSPTTESLGPAETLQLIANPRPDVGPDVNWSLNPSVGTISATGLYSAPGFISSPQSVNVIATSQKSPQYTAAATISLTPGPPLHLIPTTASLIGSETKQFRFQQNPGGQVQWRLHPSIGSISSSGLYSAPPVIPAAVKVKVTASLPAAEGAASTENPPTAYATVDLQPASVSPVDCTPQDHHRYMCQAVVKNASNTAVQWSVNPAIGNITPQGIYTAPAKVKPPQTVVITASSQADPSKSSTFALALSSGPEVTATIRPHAQTLEAGRSLQFSATITGSNNRSVTWSASGGGTMLPSGVYQAPASVPAKGLTVRITATSNANPETQATTDITVIPTAQYAGPTSGTVTWRGKIEKNKTLRIVNNIPDQGNITGLFPGMPINVTLQTKGCTIIVNPSQASGWKSIEIATQKKQTTIYIVWQIP